MRTPDQLRRLLPVAVLLAPVAVVQLTAALLGGGLQSVQAQGDLGIAMPAAPTSAAPIPATPEALRAADYARLLSEEHFSVSPFVRTVAAAPAPVIEAPRPVAPGAPELVVNITSIMKSPRGAMAVIDGQVCRDGAAVAGGAWTVTAIDGAEGVITFRHQATGQVVTRQVRRD